jgi:peptidoglycan/LPS O-acetylase OafA/YrhL
MNCVLVALEKNTNGATASYRTIEISNCNLERTYSYCEEYPYSLYYLFHLNISGFQSGFLGVDAFFVISGYLMAIIFDKGTPLDFYIRRFRRRFPAYALTVVSTLFIASLTTIPTDFGQVVDQSFFASIFSSNIGFWLQGNYFSRAEFNPLLHLWSLGVEAQFYLIVPFLFLLLKRRKSLTIMLALVSFATCLLVASISPKTAFFHLPLRIWEFLLGAMVAWHCTNTSPQHPFSNYVAPLAFICLIAANFVPIQPENLHFGFGHPGILALIVCSLSAVVIAYGLPSIFSNSFVGKALALVGKYSYSLYLVHFPIIILLNYSPFDGTKFGYSSIKTLCVLLLLIIICSVLMFHFVESRSHHLFRSWRPYVILLALTCLAGAAITGNHRSYSDEQKNIFSAWTDRAQYRCGKIFRLLNPLKNICEITSLGDKANRNVLLIGNSHADSLKTAFAKNFGRNNIGVYFYVPSTPLIANFYDESAVALDAAKLSVNAVVLHFDIGTYNEAIISKISALANRLRAQDIRLFLISPVPGFNVHIPKHLYRMTRSNLAPPHQTASDHYYKTASFWRAANSNLFGETIIIDITKALCSTKCEIRDEFWHPYYFDSHHLTLKGATKLNSILVDLAHRILTQH